MATALQIIGLICLVFLFGTVLVAVITVVRRILYNHRLAKEKALTTRYQTYLAELISGQYKDEMLQLLDTTRETSLALTVEDITKPKLRKRLLKLLLELHSNVAGNQANQLRDLYLTLGFKAEALKKLKSANWSQVVEGIEEVQQMYLRDVFPELFKLVHHSHDMVRLSAIRARITLEEADPFAFLDDYQDILSDWEKHWILHAFKQRADYTTPDFSRWHNHDNPTVAEFTKVMSEYYNQIIPKELEMRNEK